MGNRPVVRKWVKMTANTKGKYAKVKKMWLTAPWKMHKVPVKSLHTT